jgi:hypothetical protein
MVKVTAFGIFVSFSNETLIIFNNGSIIIYITFM